MMGTKYPVIKGPKVVIDYQIGGGQFIGTDTPAYRNSISHELYVLGGANLFRVQRVYFCNGNAPDFRGWTEKINRTNCQQFDWDNGNSNQYRIITEKINKSDCQQFHFENATNNAFRIISIKVNGTNWSQIHVVNTNDTSFRMWTEKINCLNQQVGGLATMRWASINIGALMTQSETVAPEYDTNEDNTTGLKIGQSVTITNT